MTVRTLPLPAKGQKTYRDDSLQGFAVRVSQGGAKTFLVIHGQKRQFITIGRYPLTEQREAQHRQMRIYQDTPLTDALADHAIMSMYRTGVIGVQRIRSSPSEPNAQKNFRHSFLGPNTFGLE